MYTTPKLSREDIAMNSLPNHLYVNEVPEHKVKFYRVVLEEDESTTYQASTRTQIQLTRKLTDGEFSRLEIVKMVSGKETGRVVLPKFTLEEMYGFMQIIAGMGVDDSTARRSLIVNENLKNLDSITREAIVETLSGAEGMDVVKELIDSGALNEKDFVNTGYRRVQLGIFYKLLYENHLATYKEEEMGKPNTKDEIAWQHFFAKNPWIFGHGLGVRFNTILQKEFAASDTTAAGKEQVNADFLLADTRFTTFVELKRPDTPLFGPAKNRARAWKLSTELQDAKSQILEQKASGTLKLEQTRDLTDDQGRLITQRAYDPRVIVVIGSWSEITDDVYQEKLVKQKTFELFRRDSRNVEFITYDELYEKAHHIVTNGLPDQALAA
ncbi:hypothetical protein CEQ90_13625 [Lewinellaceae bacterium SD302]|nr:hypothetical protein CEQ90_13625 [Lewinellaceae bacterium SD302]